VVAAAVAIVGGAPVPPEELVSAEPTGIRGALDMGGQTPLTVEAGDMLEKPAHCVNQR